MPPLSSVSDSAESEALESMAERYRGTPEWERLVELEVKLLRHTASPSEIDEYIQIKNGPAYVAYWQARVEELLAAISAIRAARSAEYAAFIDAWEATHGAETTCREATQHMVDAFPELKRVRGMVVMVGSPDGDVRPWPHWWCVTAEGEVVDPTRDQFPCLALTYHPIDESRGDPTGKCMCCGFLCFGGDAACSPECDAELTAYLRA